MPDETVYIDIESRSAKFKISGVTASTPASPYLVGKVTLRVGSDKRDVLSASVISDFVTE